MGLGSNLGDRWANLRLGLAQMPGLIAISRVYETVPVGGPPGQGNYLNLVAELSEPAEGPEALLAAARAAEGAAGRQRQERWGPRTLDVDLLLVGRACVDTPDLVLPHPRMWSRGFVLVPLADLAPELVEGHLDEAMREGVQLAGTIWRTL